MIRCRTNFALLLTLSAAGAILGNGLAARADGLAGKADLFLSRSASHQSRQGWTSLIVKTNGDLTPEQETHLKMLGADVYRHLPIIESVALRVPTRNLKQLAKLSFITRLSDDLRVKKCDEFTVGASGADVAFAQQGLTGDSRACWQAAWQYGSGIC